MSKTLPWRTLATPETPSDLSAPSIAFPWGSRTPAFNVTVTRAFMAQPRTPDVASLHRGGHGRCRKALGGRKAPETRDLRFARSPASGDLSAFDQDRAVGPLVLAHDAEPLGDLRIGLEQAAEVAAEAILVELLARLDVPQPARVRGNLVGDDDAHHVVFPQPTAFHLEVYQADGDAEEESR